MSGNKKKQIIRGENVREDLDDNKIIEEEFIYEDLDDNKINYFPNGIIKEFTTGLSILKYKLAIYWMPILLFTIIMFILANTIFDSAVFDRNIIKTEIIGAFMALVVMFVCYFIVDFIYQVQLCKDQKLDKHLLNSLFNAIHISIVVTLGYIIGIFIEDTNLINAGIAKQDLDSDLYAEQEFNTDLQNRRLNKIDLLSSIDKISSANKTTGDFHNYQELIQTGQQRLFRLMLTSSQHNNIFMAIIFYFIGMAYWNPYYDEKCSRNRICKKKKNKIKNK